MLIYAVHHMHLNDDVTTTGTLDKYGNVRSPPQAVEHTIAVTTACGITARMQQCDKQLSCAFFLHCSVIKESEALQR